MDPDRRVPARAPVEGEDAGAGEQGLFGIERDFGGDLDRGRPVRPGSVRGPGAGSRCEGGRGGRRGRPVVSRPPRAPKAISIRLQSRRRRAVLVPRTVPAEVEGDRHGTVAGDVARRDRAVEGDDDAGAAALLGAGRPDREGGKDEQARVPRRGRVLGASGGSLEPRGLEGAVVEAEGDDDVVRLVPLVDEVGPDALEAGDVFGAKGGGGPSQAVGLASQGGEPAGRGWRCPPRAAARWRSS